jgi:histidinol phosphatase-like enzyme
MRVIFLDIDGVLNANDDFGGKKKPNPYVSSDDGYRYCGISTSKVRRLKWIVDKTDAKIVLVSSWKGDYEDYLRNHTNRVGKYLYNKLRKQDLRIFDTTYRFSLDFHSYRGTEISTWLANQKEPVESWVVLDDEIFRDYRESIIPNLILTSETDGLTTYKARLAACKLLGLPDDAFDTPFDKFAKELTNVAMPNLIENDLVIIKPAGPQKKI